MTVRESSVIIRSAMKIDVIQFERALIIKGWTQKDLAAKAAVSETIVCNFLNGKTITNPNLKKIADALAVDLETVVQVEVKE